MQVAQNNTQTNATRRKKHRDHHKARVMSCFKFKKGNVHGEEKERENDREKASERAREREREREITDRNLRCSVSLTSIPVHRWFAKMVQLRSSIMRHIVIQ